MTLASSVDADEVAKFSAIADEWWDPHGKFAPLHRIQPIRMEYILKQMSERGMAPAGTRILDIGCGGGLMAEPMARLGAQVTGVDASAKNIRVAGLHAEQNGVVVDYRHSSAEALAEAGESFDVVLALEIIEHVADVGCFMDALAKLVRPGGILIMSTINRTAKAFALAIVGAEYLLRWLPRGTHDWQKFITPGELSHFGSERGLRPFHSCGMVMNPISFTWRLDARDHGVNYLLTFERP